MAEFNPFAETPQATNLGDLTVTSDADHVIIQGDLEIHRDQAGLEHARRLRDMLASIVAALEEQELPPKAELADPNAVQTIDNPFGSSE